MSISIITPEEAKGKHCELPDFMAKAINDLIVKNYRAGGFSISQKDLLEKAYEYYEMECSREYRFSEFKSMCFNNDWLEIEGFCEASGWRVSYVRSDYDTDDDYTSYFQFKSDFSI